MEWTVKKDVTTRLTLGDGPEWIEVRSQLSVGEEREIARRSARSYQQATPDEQGKFTIDYDVTRYSLVQAAAYLVAWSAPIPLPVNFSLDKKIAIVESLNPDVFRLVEEAIDGFLKQQKEAKEEAKKDQGGESGETGSTRTSPPHAA